jgi:ABC-type antimicrobial peptide transport system permease subunit
MTSWKYILSSLRQYRRVHLAVAAGVAVTTAVITGALLVGSSVRGSLRDLALSSLGRIDSVVIGEQPFREALGEELRADPAVKSLYAEVVPVLKTRGAATFQSQGDSRRATGLQVSGVPPAFWSLTASSEPVKSPLGDRQEMAITRAIAAELGVKVGDFIVLRLLVSGSSPADSVLGEKDEAVTARRMQVAAIVDDRAADSMARFSLRPSQQAPRNVFVPLARLQDMLNLDGKVNLLALAVEPGQAKAAAPSPELAQVRAALRPQLEDFGLKVAAIDRQENSRGGYIRISGDRLVLPPTVVEAAKKLFGQNELQPVVTYLANAISAGERRIPYSTVAGVDSTAGLGPVIDESGEPVLLAEDEIALNDWAADDLNVEVGGEVQLTWYDPETTHGRLRELPPLGLRVRAIVPLVDAEGNATSAADPNFAPELPGVTDQRSIDEWKLPFELVEDVREEDDVYWEKHRTTPKAFVSHALAARLWSTRWGTESVLRIPLTEGRSADVVREELRDSLDPARLGMMLVPAKSQALAAASGTTPFDGLFLGFSFFLMASAMMLTALLFRLGVEQRAREVGLLSAIGMAPSRVRRLLIGEAAVVAVVGALLGAMLGIAYARLMVHGLNTWWVAATSAPFLVLHAPPTTIAAGFAVGLAVALATIAWSLRRFARLAPRQLLAGDSQPPLAMKSVARWSQSALPIVCIALAISMGIAAARLEGEAQAGAFFGGGALVLVGLLSAVRGKLREPRINGPASLSLAGLAARNARRNPSRTMLSLGLAATASFLIVALSAFRLAPTDRGTGGFDLLGASDLPMHYDLNSEQGRRELGFSDEDNRRLEGTEILGFRVRDGEDASCLNLYQTTQPRVLGAPTAQLAEHSRFMWASVADSAVNPWQLLDPETAAGGGVPMALDRNTAFYSLKLYKVGEQLTIRDDAGRDAPLEIVGMLANSVLQGDSIVSEANFLRLFPESAGRRFFLIRRGAQAPATGELASLLETQLEDFGFDAVDARDRLAELMAVQNTYLSTFQSLGALGLLLGAVGLAVAQVRSVLERRGELALMQAAGFRRRRLVWMVLVENLVLLAGGLLIGCVAALAAVLPQAIVEQVGAPWRTLGVLLGIVAAAGVVAGWLAARAALSAPLVPALRGD